MSKASQIWWSVMTCWQEVLEVESPDRRTSVCKECGGTRTGTLLSRKRNRLRGLAAVARAETINAELVLLEGNRKYSGHFSVVPVMGFLLALSEDPGRAAWEASVLQCVLRSCPWKPRLTYASSSATLHSETPAHHELSLEPECQLHRNTTVRWLSQMCSYYVN